MHRPITTALTTRDPEQAHALVAEAYSDNSLRVSGSTENFRFHQQRHDLGDVRLDSFHNTMTTQYSMEPLGCLVVCRVRRGTVDIVAADGQEQRVGPGQVVLVAPADRPYRTRVHGAHLELVGVDLPLLAQLAAEDGRDAIDDRLHRLTHQPLPPQAAATWQRTVARLGEVADPRDHAATHPLVLGALGRLLAATLLATFDRTTDQDESGAPSPDSTVRRAVAYLESNPDLDLGVADIARACHVSVRTLQLAFRRELDTTPMAQLRRIRLDRVHEELRAADPSAGATVGTIAGRWGFASASRFAAFYRAAYGVPPSVTLRDA